MGVCRHVSHVMPKVQTIALEHMFVKKSLGISLSLSIYIYRYIHARIYTYIDIYIYMRIHIYIYVYLSLSLSLVSKGTITENPRKWDAKKLLLFWSCFPRP